MKTFSILFFLILVFSNSFAQTKSIFTNAKKIDDTRYAEYKGSPYLFDDWVIGDIYDGEKKAFEQMELNFNGYSNNVEVKKEDKFVELDTKWYTKIEVQSKDGLLTFRRGLHTFFKDKFVETVYTGKDFYLVKKFRTGLTEKEINDVGKTIKIKRFEKNIDYYFIKNGKLNQVKMKKKSLLSYLGHKKEIGAFLKENKLKLTRQADLKKVLAFYEEQGF